MAIFLDILGTLRNSFRIGRATVSSSALTVARTVSLPDAAGVITLGGQFHQLPSIAVGHGATTPDPGAAGVWAWSSTLSRPVLWDGANWAAHNSITAGTSAPGNPHVGDVWIDTN